MRMYSIKQAEANVKEKKRFLKEADEELHNIKSIVNDNSEGYHNEVAYKELQFVEAEEDLGNAEDYLKLLYAEKLENNN